MSYTDINTLRNDINRDIKTNTTRSMTGAMVREYLFGLCDVASTICDAQGHGLPYYGVSWKFASDGSATIRRIGNPIMHQALPIQSKMKGCVLRLDGTVNYYLFPYDWKFKDDGYTPSVLTGADGDVMVEIPDFWYSYEIDGNGLSTLLISEFNLNGYVENNVARVWTKFSKCYVGAYKAQINTNGLLQSIADTFAANYGHNNYNNTTNTSLISFRDYARRKVTNDNRWNIITYNIRKAIWMLFVTEYATLNSQENFNSQLTVDGYRQGGLGAGITNGISAGNIGTYAQTKTGYSNEYGNFSIGTLDLTESDIYTGSTLNTNNKKCRYRGIENPFGEVWEWTDGVYVTNYGAYEVIDKSNFTKLTASSYTGIVATECRAIGSVEQTGGGHSIKTIIGDKYCDILPTEVSDETSGSKYYRDGWWINSGFRGVLFGGDADNGALAGLACANALSAPSSTYANVGSRLAYIPD